MATLDGLSAARRTQYDALRPEITRKAREASAGRGMFYSGDATDAETRADADLLARLAAQDAGDQQQSSESDLQRKLDRENVDKGVASNKRTATLGALGAGASSAATLYMLQGQLGKSGMNIVTANGHQLLVDSAGKTVKDFGPIEVGGSTMAAPTGAAGTGGAGVVGGGPVTLRDPMEGAVRGGPQMSPLGTEMVRGPMPSAAPASMWTLANMKGALTGSNYAGGAAGALAAGGLGGLGGNRLARSIGGGGGLGTDIGSGVGGAGGGLAAAMYARNAGYGGWGSLAALGLGAGLGSLGGGLIGNLFR